MVRSVPARELGDCEFGANLGSRTPDHGREVIDDEIDRVIRASLRVNVGDVLLDVVSDLIASHEVVFLS
ncbi:hypothetical protein [Gordonia sihwensis]|uniref:hypothetical protein n=1 Tax=Gordonia sihwensis TaxID=173559 RepID=UPI003D996B8F